MIRKDIFICKGCRLRWSFEEQWRDAITQGENEKEIRNVHRCGECWCRWYESQDRKSLAPEEAKFYCPKCNLYTNDKTPRTSCIYCNESLIRTAGQPFIGGSQ